MGLNNFMQVYPKKKSAEYSEQLGVRVEKELKQSLEMLKATTDIDVQEAIRMKLRELVRELQAA